MPFHFSNLPYIVLNNPFSYGYTLLFTPDYLLSRPRCCNYIFKSITWSTRAQTPHLLPEARRKKERPLIHLGDCKGERGTWLFPEVPYNCEDSSPCGLGVLTGGAVPLSRLLAYVLYTNVMVRKGTVIFIMYFHPVQQCCHQIGWPLTLDRGEYTSGFMLHRIEQQNGCTSNSSRCSNLSRSSGSSRNSSKEPH